MPLHSLLAESMGTWKQESPYSQPGDWVFPSPRLKGKKPRCANMLVEDYLRPAAVKAGVLAKCDSRRFGIHNLRHSLASFLIRTKNRPYDRSNFAPSLEREDNAADLCSQRVRRSVGGARGSTRGVPATARERGGQLIMGGRWVEGNYVITVKLKTKMVGTWGLEPQTSTVSR